MSYLGIRVNKKIFSIDGGELVQQQTLYSLSDALKAASMVSFFSKPVTAYLDDLWSLEETLAVLYFDDSTDEKTTLSASFIRVSAYLLNSVSVMRGYCLKYTRILSQTKSSKLTTNNDLTCFSS